MKYISWLLDEQLSTTQYNDTPFSFHFALSFDKSKIADYTLNIDTIGT